MICNMKKKQIILSILLVIVVLGDIISTIMCVNVFSDAESNPLVNMFKNITILQVCRLIPTAISVIGILMLHRMKERTQKLILVLSITTIVVLGIAVINNFIGYINCKQILDECVYL